MKFNTIPQPERPLFTTSERVVYILRHGLSYANDYRAIGTATFGHKDAELMPEGITQARKMGRELLGILDINSLHDTPAATSTLHRAHQTASESGLSLQTQYHSLDEFDPDAEGMTRAELRRAIDQNELPSTAIQNAAKTLSDPPNENIWVSHGVQIAALCAVLGQHQDARLIPRFCEIRKIHIDRMNGC